MDIETLKMNVLMELIDLKYEAMENTEIDNTARIEELELIRRLVRLAYVANCLRNEGPSVLPALEDELDGIFTEEQ